MLTSFTAIQCMRCNITLFIPTALLLQQYHHYIIDIKYKQWTVDQTGSSVFHQELSSMTTAYAHTHTYMYILPLSNGFLLFKVASRHISILLLRLTVIITEFSTHKAIRLPLQGSRSLWLYFSEHKCSLLFQSLIKSRRLETLLMTLSDLWRAFQVL